MLSIQICLAWLVLGCGQIVFWWRRDNILGYLQFGFFFATILVPALFTSIVSDLDPTFVNQYADLLVVGAIAYMIGLCYGASLGQRMRLPRLVVGWPLDRLPRVLVLRTRQTAAGAVVILAGSFVLLGYVPFLAADRVSAKYGVGVYATGFARGSLVLHVGLIVASTILPVVLALVVVNRRRIDVALAGALLLALTLTLSRQKAFIGPLVFLAALAIQRRWRPWRIGACVCFAFVGGTLVNELVALSSPAPGTTFAQRMAASVPDIVDHVGFLRGYESRGSEQIGLTPIIASLSLNKGDNNPSTYALKVRTGLDDITGLAAGGIRLPAPLWGYVAFGYPGAIAWSLLSGVAMGWGTRLVARLVAGVQGHRRQCLNLVLAWLFFEGTFQVLADFYFFERVGIVSFALALYVCRIRLRSPDVASATPASAATPSALDPSEA